MKIIQKILLLCIVTLIASCSTSAKGPISGREYKVQVGGWQNMDNYNEARDDAVKNRDRDEEDVIDCNVVDCPEMIRKDGTE